MEQVGIDIGSCANCFAKWFRKVIRELFLDFPINSIHPIIVLFRQIIVVRNISAETDRTLFELVKISI